MAELANCAQCGNLFLKGTRTICRACYEKEEEAFQKVYQFMRQRKNREATMTEIVEHTGVEEELIIKFIKEKRLLPTEFPNIGYPCSHCGKKITSGNLCQACLEKLRKDLEQHEELEDRMNEKEEREKKRTYYMFDDKEL
ncbi:TIGR03826 family flagellar region protein [Virgibacillus proomii]|jgi:flagellar operon protein (TIGR03826 family)|uniref:TIGR03826 family flagellar region protein n=1 Tax=Virgibacillus proomii TaxID=84407 RepID=UPI00098573AC|nr:TIGR03826 family flagellar region protein [Virgibacillus proomii]